VGVHFENSSGILAVELLQVASAMGMFQVRVRVSNPSERSRFFEENFWVDTGALYSFVPEGGSEKSASALCERGN